jgi:FkbM family methyltransferase
MSRKIHKFDNGVCVYDDHLMPAQRQRYKIRNVHEADEEDLFIEIVTSLTDNACFVNIGSAIGYYVILAKKLSPKLLIHAVEPLPLFRNYLNENILLNNLKQQDFVIHKYAVGATDGRTGFLEKGYESQLLAKRNGYGIFQLFTLQLKNLTKGVLGRIGVKRYAAGSGVKTEIDTVSLETLLNQVGQQIDLLTMDVQGLEFDILSGGQGVLDRADIKTFIIGTHGKAIHQQCINILTNNDYAIEYEKQNTQHQPDGIIIASKGVQRLASRAGE